MSCQRFYVFIVSFLIGVMISMPALASLTCSGLFPATKEAYGYHASPELSLKLLDPSFSRNTSRYGPGVYLYADQKAVQDHAKAISEGRIKYDKNNRPARVYKAKLHLDRALDMTKTYQLSSLNYITARLGPENPFVRQDPSSFITGQEFYDQLAGHFAASVKISLDRGVVGLTTAKSKANQWLLEAGIQVLIGQIPVPQSDRFEKAYISLVPIAVK